MKHRVNIAVCILSLAMLRMQTYQKCEAGHQFTIEEIKAVYLLNFGRFAEWPASALDKHPDRFNVCIVGSDPLGEKLDAAFRNQKVKDRKVEILRLPPNAAITDCQIAYLHLDTEAETNEVLSKLRNHPTLTVGDPQDFIERGGIIQFQQVEENLRFSISLTAADRARITISSKLLRVAEVVK